MGSRERTYLAVCVAVSGLFALLAFEFIHIPRVAPVAGALSLIAALVFEPVREAIKSLLKTFPNPRCHLLLFGPGGCGKTQVFKCLQEKPYKHGELVTSDFDTETIRLRVGQNKAQMSFRIVLADYQGQEPFSILGDLAPKSFFGGPNSRRVDVIFVIVDLFPVRTDLANNQIDDGALVELCKSEGMSLIKERVHSNLSYFNKWNLQYLFAKVKSEKHKPYAIRFLINKIDVLSEAVAAGYISIPQGMTSQNYAITLYSSVIVDLKATCDKLGIHNFTCETMTVKNDNGTLRRWLLAILETRVTKVIK
jgi:hypothetical protein